MGVSRASRARGGTWEITIRKGWGVTSDAAALRGEGGTSSQEVLLPKKRQTSGIIE